MEATDYVNALRLRQDLLDSRAEAESLRYDLGDATALIEALEAELSAVTARWRGQDQGRSATAAVGLLIQARTQVRRTLFQDLASEQDRASAERDLRVAEVAFSFLLGFTPLAPRTAPGLTSKKDAPAYPG